MFSLARIVCLTLSFELISLAIPAVADDLDPQAKAMAAERGIELKNETVEATKIKEGWSRTYDLPSHGTETAGKLPEKVQVWIEQGWLNVRAINEHGRTDWQVALAQADGKTPVEVNIDIGFALQYGQYFVRDDTKRLRLFRQLKNTNSPAWPEMKYEGEVKKNLEQIWQTSLLPQPVRVESRGLQVVDWLWLESGAAAGHPDLWIRMEHKDLFPATAAISSFPMIGIHGQTFYDEGDLAFSTRDSISNAEHRIDIQNLRAALKTKPVPEIDCHDWIHTEDGAPVSLVALRGHVVLLDFWATGYIVQPPHEEKLEELYQKYKDRGFIVVAVYDGRRTRKLDVVLKDHKFSYPAGVDSDESAKRFGVETTPTQFLINKQGTVQESFETGPGRVPKEANIEKLLDAN